MTHENTRLALRRAIQAAHPEFTLEQVEFQLDAIVGFGAHVSHDGSSDFDADPSKIKHAMTFDSATVHHISRSLPRRPNESDDQHADRQLRALGMSIADAWKDGDPCWNL